MPPLDHPAPILAATGVARARPAHPSPSYDGLRFEVLTGKELAYRGQIVGVDIPLLLMPTGWGEYVVINAGPAQR